MSPEQLAMYHSSEAAVVPSVQLQRLFDKSFTTLESILNNEAVSIHDRTAIALKIVEMLTKSTDTVASDLENTSIYSTSAQATTSLDAVQETFVEPAIASSELDISYSWQCWIAENKLLNKTDESMIQVMVRSGIDEQVAKEAIDRVTSEASFQAGGKYVQLLNKLESILDTQQRVLELDPGYTTVERRSRLSRQEFFEQYYLKGKPVILTDMMDDWPAMSLWSPEYIKANFAHVEVEIQANRNTDAEFEINKAYHKKVVTLGDYVDMVVRGGETNDYYLTANNGALDRPELKQLLNDIVMFPDYLDGSDTTNKVFFWLGPAGTITPLHHDANNLIMAQVSGRKLWRIISPNHTPFVYNYFSVFSKVDCEHPDYNRYPLFTKARVIEALVGPGEAIFIPVGWWHHVKALDLSFSVSFTNFVFPNQYEYRNPDITTW